MAPATVLLIDGDADSIAIYSLILEHGGYRVVHASDGETGLKLAHEINPDVVISGVFFPPTRTGSVVQALRSDRRTAATPLIVLDSTRSIAGDLPGDSGAVCRLTKPCEPSRLLQEVVKLLSPLDTVGGPGS